MERWLLPLLGLVMLALVPGCSGGGDGGGLPGNRATFEGTGFAVGYPEGWEVVEGGRVDDTSEVEVINTDADAAVPPLIRVTRMPNMAHLSDINAVAVSLTAALRGEVSDLSVSDQAEAEVEGAESAVSMQLAYTDEVDGTSVELRELALVAVPASESEDVLAVRFVAPADRFEELASGFQDLAGTFRLQ